MWSCDRAPKFVSSRVAGGATCSARSSLACVLHPFDSCDSSSDRLAGMSVTWSIEQFAHNNRLLFPSPLLKRSDWLKSWRQREVFVYSPTDGTCGRLVWVRSAHTDDQPHHLELDERTQTRVEGCYLHVRGGGRSIQLWSADRRVVEELAGALAAAARPSRLSQPLPPPAAPLAAPAPACGFTTRRRHFVSWADADAPLPGEALFVSWAQPSWAMTSIGMR